MANSISAITTGIGGVVIDSVDTTGNLNLKSGGTTVVAVTSTGASVTGLLEGSTNYTGFKNRIINGAMVIDQRYAGASGAVTGAAYVVDRWRIIRVGGTSTLTCGQSSTAPTGLTNSFLVTAGSGATPATTEERSLSQPIEGFNVSDLGWGAAGAQSITISFWVQSSVTGTYGLLLGNGAGNRGYVASYTINAANTWEYKTVTVAGDTSGTWLKTNGNGLTIYWDLGTGPTYSGAVTGAWQASYFEGLTGGTKLSATSGATFYITGVQLEKGSTATSFDVRDYGRELMMCQRYYWQTPVTLGQVLFDVYSPVAGGQFKGLSIASMFVEPRATPTITVPVQTAVNVSGTPAFVYVGGAIQCGSASTAVGRAVIITNAGFITATGMEL
jgi:hypothetical protein